MKCHIKNNSGIKSAVIAMLAIETAIPLAVSVIISYIVKSSAIGFLLFLPISSICLRAVHHLSAKSKRFAPIILSVDDKLCIHKSLLSNSATKYFKSLHNSSKTKAMDILTLFKAEKRASVDSKRLYEIIAGFRLLLIIINTFRIFYAALLFESRIQSLMVSIAIASVVLSDNSSKNIKSAIAQFITLPQRSTVIFDAIFRAILTLLFSKTFLYKWFGKSQYSYLHSDKFIHISSYFWSFSTSCFLLFSQNTLIALCGLSFMFSPLYLMCRKCPINDANMQNAK